VGNTSEVTHLLNAFALSSLERIIRDYNPDSLINIWFFSFPFNPEDLEGLGKQPLFFYLPDQREFEQHNPYHCILRY
jgi:hypothetical protein